MWSIESNGGFNDGFCGSRSVEGILFISLNLVNPFRIWKV